MSERGCGTWSLEQGAERTIGEWNMETGDRKIERIRKKETGQIVINYQHLVLEIPFLTESELCE